jgi:hypothetical protein
VSGAKVLEAQPCGWVSFLLSPYPKFFQPIWDIILLYSLDGAQVFWYDMVVEHPFYCLCVPIGEK